MPDIIERTIYQMEMDDSGYIRGADRITGATQRISSAQVEANRRLQEAQSRLQTNQAALNGFAANIVKARTELQNYTGTNERFKKQLENDVVKLEKHHAALTQTVKENQKAYEEAAQAAQKFVNVSQPPAGLTFGAGGAQPSFRPPIGGLTFGPQGAQPSFPTVLPTVSPELRLLLEQIKSVNPEDFANVFELSTEAMQEFRAEIEALELVLESATEEEKIFNEEFKNLAIVVSEGKKIIEEFDKSTAEAARSSLGYRQQITLLHKELTILEQAGKKETQEYKNKLQEITKLKRAQQDLIQTQRILASETKFLDFGRSAITTATSAFQAYTSVAILAGGASEDLQKKTFQLFAAMQLITSLEQLNNQLKRVSVIRTNAQAAAQSAYTAVVGASTGALKAFRVALASTGVGVALVALGVLVNKIIEWREEQKKIAEEAKFLQSINEEAIEGFSQQVTHLELIRSKLVDTNIATKERVKLAKEYNKTAEEGNKIDVKQLDNIELINSAIDQQIIKIKARAVARAAENALVKEADKVFLEREKARERAEKSLDAERRGLVTRPEDLLPETRLTADPVTGQIVTKIISDEERIADKIANDPKLKQAEENFNKRLKQVAPFISVDDLITIDDKKTPGTPSKIENVFKEELQRLLDRQRQLRIEAEKGIKRINDEFALKMDLEKRRIAKLLEDKKITEPQAKILIDVAATTNKQELERALEDFNKAVIDKRERLNQDLHDLQMQNLTDSIGLIQDEFTRRAAIIDDSEKKEIESIRRTTKARLDDLQKLGEETGTTGYQQFQIEKNEIVQAGQDAETNIVRRAAAERQQLAFDSFKQTLGLFDQTISDSKLFNDQAALAEIQALVNLREADVIDYEEYKKRLAAIQKKYEDAQLQTTIDTLQAELTALRQRREFAFNLTAAQYDELIKLIKQKEAELVAAQTRQATATGEGTKPEKPPQVETVEEYAQAIGQLTEAVISFWAEANRAEQEALDRSIEIQEKRVEAAQKIAERGNAQYLKMEEDRLKELQIARENAARREIAINSAVQASQLLVGITGAISKIANPATGIAETIASMAVIVSSLAAGFALVRTLNANQPRFAEGTTYVQRGSRPKGKDTIPAWLDEGEAVIPQKKNKKYKQSVEAIYHGKVPAEVLNEFVENYITNKTNKTVTATTNKYESFVENIKKVPAKVLNTFIENYHKRQTNYEEKKYFRGTPELKGERGIDRIPIFASHGEAIIPAEKNRLFKPVINALFENKIPAEHLNNFVTNYSVPDHLNKMIERYHDSKHEINNFTKHVEKYHHTKQAPRVNYDRVKAAAEIHVSSDGKLALLISEQNRKIDENNELQKSTIRTLKAMKMAVNLDKRGFAASWMEIVEQKEKDKKV